MTWKHSLAITAACVTALLIAGCGVITTPAPVAGSPTRIELEKLLEHVTVTPSRVHTAGYQRGCKSGQGCVFGPAWTDDNATRLGHDGCDTRNNVLALQMSSVQFRNGTHDCVVVSGTLADPYTGTPITFTKREGGEVQIDHVYPLAAAWDMGASRWPIDERTRFANDVDFNLLAVDGHANQSKSDGTPSDWLPPSIPYRCFYAGKYLTVAAQYQLPITEADRDALMGVAAHCS